MLVNAAITGFKRRTGADATGAAVYTEADLLLPVGVTLTALTARQQETLAAVGVAADAAVVIRPRPLAAVEDAAPGELVPEAGDLLEIGGLWYEAVRAERFDRGAIRRVNLLVRRYVGEG